MKRLATVMLILSIWPVHAQQNGEPRITSRSREIFDNTECAANNTCDLLQVRYLAEDYEILADGGMHYGTRLFAHYLTDSLDTLENYAFVQFIKGCQYHSYNDQRTLLTVSRDHFSGKIIFNHKNWTIDSIDNDPVYFSMPESRHFHYKWNLILGSTSQGTERFYGIKKPTHPEMYITDRPGTAFYLSGMAKNISLAFKTCLYKTSDIPRENLPEDVNFAKPVRCFYWYSSWVYNHETQKFKNPYAISPVCEKE